MNQTKRDEPTPKRNLTRMERTSKRELVVTRTFDAPVHLVFDAWTKPELFMQWWVPKSSGATLLSCEMDVRVGGGYRLEYNHPSSDRPMIFCGTYIDVLPNARIVWTNEDSADGQVTTVTFEEAGGKTLLVLHDLYPSKDTLDEALAGMEGGAPEQHEQLDALLATLVWLSGGEVMKKPALQKTSHGEAPPTLPVAMTGKASLAKAAVGDQPVFEYIASLPQPQRSIAERVDVLATETLPDLQRAVKWGMAYYGVDGGWCFSSGAFVGHVKLMFIRGTEITPEPPVTPIGMGKSTRGVELASIDDLDEDQVASWMKQAATMPFVGGKKR